MRPTKQTQSNPAKTAFFERQGGFSLEMMHEK
jgi:hypothetical protein